MAEHLIEVPWWEQPSDDLMAESVFDFVDHLRQTQPHHFETNARYMRLYGNFVGFTGSSRSGFNIRDMSPAKATFSDNRIRLNVVQSMCDTITAKIAKNRPKPTFLTSDGDYKIQRKASQLTKFIESLFLKTNLYQVMPKAFLDSTIMESGFVELYREGKEIKVDRVLATELFFDDNECFYGDPRQMHRYMTVPRGVLLKKFPKLDGKIMTATSPPSDGLESDEADNIEVIKSWHLPSTKGADDGCYGLFISNAALWKKEWKRDYFPVVKQDWASRIIGYLGQSLAEQISPIQTEINVLLQRIQAAFKRLGIPWVFVENGSKVVTEHLRNEIALIIKYSKTPPVRDVQATVHPEVFQHLDRLVQRAYEITGISQLSASSKKPAGLDSGVAIREYNDIETERFIMVGKAYENAFMEAARQMIDLCKEIAAENGGSFPVLAKTDYGAVEQIDWADIDMDQDEYRMEAFPTALFPSTPAGQLQTANELLQLGLMDRQDIIKQLDFPDLKQFFNIENANSEYMEKIIYRIVFDGEMTQPDEQQDLELGIRMMTAMYLKYKTQNLEEEKLTMMVQWIQRAVDMLNSAGSMPPVPAMDEGQMQGQVAPQTALPPAPPEGLIS